MAVSQNLVLTFQNKIIKWLIVDITEVIGQALMAVFHVFSCIVVHMLKTQSPEVSSGRSWLHSTPEMYFTGTLIASRYGTWQEPLRTEVFKHSAFSREQIIGLHHILPVDRAHPFFYLSHQQLAQNLDLLLRTARMPVYSKVHHQPQNIKSQGHIVDIYLAVLRTDELCNPKKC